MLRLIGIKKINIAVFLVLNFFEIYSVIPKYFLLKKFVLSTGPLINLFVKPLFKILKAVSKLFSK